jgi:5'-nucleotidase (lipoprotein e(P4) family)
MKGRGRSGALSFGMPTPRGFGFGFVRASGIAVALAAAGCHAQSTGSSRAPAAPRKRPPVSQPAPPPVIEPLPGPAGTAPAGTAVMPDSVHWVRNSAEYEAAVLQAYRLATDRLDKLRAGRASGAWAVVADADETLLGNSQYQKERAAAGAGFSAESWSAWVAQRKAPALPGAVDFSKRVRDLGGRFFVVTNRDQGDCPATEANLRADGFALTAVLCRPEGAPGSKLPRFDAIGQGKVPGQGAAEVVMWIGDNIQDFPGLSQESRGTATALASFGSRFILIPNPMYGSWERVPRN